MNVTYEAIWNGFLQLKKKGVRLRTITEITPDNISYVKKLMELFEVRHVTGVKSNFGIIDKKECLLHSISHEDQPLSHAIITNAKALVEAQQYLFETLWKKGIPAKQRIKEIEQGQKIEFMEIIHDPYEAQNILSNLLKSANKEILITLPTKAAIDNKRLCQYEQEHLLQLLKNAAEHGVRLRLLVDKSAYERIKSELLITSNDSDLIEIQLLDREEQNKIITAIVDKELCLIVEVRDNKDYSDYNSSVEVLGLATYSNSESTVLSYASIFDTLWIQAELRGKHKKVSKII